MEIPFQKTKFLTFFLKIRQKLFGYQNSYPHWLWITWKKITLFHEVEKVIHIGYPHYPQVIHIVIHIADLEKSQ